MFFKHRLAFRAGQIGKEFLGGLLVLGSGENRSRIDDRRMAAIRRCRQDFYFFADSGVCFIYEPGIDIAGVDIGQDRADIFGKDDFALDFFPDAEVFQRLLRVLAGRHYFGFADADLFHRIVLQVFQLADGERRILGDNQHQLVFQQVFAGRVDHQVFCCQFVHLFGRGRNENIGGSALLDLFLQRAGGAQIVNKFNMRRFFLVVGLDFRQRVFHADGGRNIEFSGLRSVAAAGNQQTDRHDAQEQVL